MTGPEFSGPQTSAAGAAPGGGAPLTVGYSGSEASRAALRWALREAQTWGCGLDVVAVDPPNLLGLPRMPGGHVTGASSTVREALAEQRRSSGGREPDVVVRSVRGDPAVALMDAAAGSRVLVLGAGRRLGPLGFGSGRVLRGGVRNCPCPLVVVGPAVVDAPVRQLLVMADDDEAVGRWAALRARTGRVRARVVTPWGVGPLRLIDHDSERSRAHEEALSRHRRTATALDAVLRRPARSELAEGRLRDVLQHRAVAGDLVVLGRVGLHDVPVRSLPAPVAIVPPQYAGLGGYRMISLPGDRTLTLPAEPVPQER
ncbi:nucleotide-binding universal stress UspA family protein [Kineococcus xinjiangensis]|uniref:Nucleotide-binding universal stress UspA family protein n=1 Tax=Kineococcus xinjiangensis TaxID=512762 RepID=A0A2S6IDZ1_9ACTN|nr:universal stress protein [Kineococcus xinjiangensis]PPK92438.1 nucleotide-binding universal stress UspA family protein [Kineococcus xinjiangensis]